MLKTQAVRRLEKGLPPAHKKMQDPEHKLHGTSFSGCNVIVQGRLALKSMTKD